MNDLNIALELYNIIVDINTFEELKNKGWEIIMTEDGENKYEYFRDENDKYDYDKKLLNRVGILGGGKVGKTFILQNLINKELYRYFKKIKTKGISVIYPKIHSENLFVCLDTCNTLNTSLYDENKTYEELFNLKDFERLNNIKEMINDKKCINIFIEDFIIEKSNILIIVVNQLTFKEQKFLNRLKNHNNFEIMFVIHNLQFFCDIKSIEEYIENVLKKSVYSNLEIFNTYNKNKENLIYYIEKRFGNINDGLDEKQKIIHLFMGKEGSEAGNFFNNQTIKYIKDLILCQTSSKRIFDVKKEVKQFLSFNSIKYMIKEENQERPINEEDLIIKLNENERRSIKCIKNFKLKNCIIDEMGIPNFLNYSITPRYISYKGKYINEKKKEEWPALIIIIEIFADLNDIEILLSISDDYKTGIITISNSTTIENGPNIEEIETIEEKDLKEENTKFVINYNLQNFPLDNYIKIKNISPGIKIIYIKMKDKNIKPLEEIITKKKIKQKNN